MPIPSYQEMMLPLLKFYSDGKTHSAKEAKAYLIKYFNLSEQDLMEKIPSGRSSTINNRLAWAHTYLRKGLLIVSISRGVYQITERGLMLVNEKRDKLDKKYLSKFPEFSDFLNQHKINK